MFAHRNRHSHFGNRNGQRSPVAAFFHGLTPSGRERERFMQEQWIHEKMDNYYPNERWLGRNPAEGETTFCNRNYNEPEKKRFLERTLGKIYDTCKKNGLDPWKVMVSIGEIVRMTNTTDPVSAVCVACARGMRVPQDATN